MKKVRLSISTFFPKNHKKAGQFTAFPDKIVYLLILDTNLKNKKNNGQRDFKKL